MNNDAKQFLMAAAVAGILGATPTLSSVAFAVDDAKGTCTEKNSCTGKGNCAGKASGKEHDCAGKNACSKNQIYSVTKEKCDKYGGEWKANPKRG